VVVTVWWWMRLNACSSGGVGKRRQGFWSTMLTSTRYTSGKGSAVDPWIERTRLGIRSTNRERRPLP